MHVHTGETERRLHNQVFAKTRRDDETKRVRIEREMERERDWA